MFRKQPPSQETDANTHSQQNEAALERVRARAMSMHTSEELSEAAELLYSEFKKLGVTPYSCEYVINDDEINRWQVWMTNASDDYFKTVWTLPYDADRHLKNRYDSWKRKDASLLGAPIPKGGQTRDAKYSPMVVITTQQFNGSTTITIKDNGIGMSQETIDKVFQPFFTTKPTGQGTGLGMSISFDIITKGHGGELKVKSEEGVGSQFTIQLPVKE